MVKAIWMDVKFVGRAESTLLFTPLDYFYLTQFSFLQMEHFYRKASYLAIQKTSLNFCLFPEQSASVCQGLGMHRLCAGTICTVPVQILTPALGVDSLPLSHQRCPYLFIIDLQEFFIYSGYKFLVKFMLC